MFFFSYFNQCYYIIICVYWFELFSQVSDVAHGPLVKILCICSIHGIPSIFMWKKPYLTLIVVKPGRFCVWNISGKTLLFALNFNYKKANSWNFEKLINDIWMGILFIVVRKKMGGHLWNIEEGLSQTFDLKMCQIRGCLI